MIHDSDCEPYRRRLFLLLEDACDDEENRELRDHLGQCESCREELESEQALSVLLSSSNRWTSKPRRSCSPSASLRLRTLGLVASLLVILSVSWHLSPSTEAFGSISSSRLLSVAWEDGEGEALEESNHVQVPHGTSATIDIHEVGSIVAIGPATFELDKTPHFWKITLHRGQLEVVIENDEKIEAASSFGSRTLGSGSWVVELRKDFFSGRTVTPKESVAVLLDRSFGAFYERRFADMERGLQSVLDHPNTDPDQRSQALFYLAAAQANQNQHEETLRTIAQWLLEHPDELSGRESLLAWRGNALWAMGARDEARTAWREVLALNPDSSYLPSMHLGDDPQALLDSAYSAFHAFDWSTMEADLQAALAHPETSKEQRREALFYLASAQANQNQHEETLKTIAQWLLEHPDELSGRESLLAWRGNALWALGARDEARTAWREVLALNPDSPYLASMHFGDDPQALLDSAYSAFYAFDWSTMEADLQAALAHPETSKEQRREALFYLAAAQANQNQHEETLRTIAQWLLEHPDELSGRESLLAWRGNALWALGARDEARAAWREALALNPDSSYLPYMHLGDDPQALLDSAYSAFHAFDWSTMEADLKSALAHPDTSKQQRGEALFYLAAAQSNQKHYEDTLETIALWMREHPSETKWRESLLAWRGKALWELGSYEEARASWREVLELNPDSPYEPNMSLEGPLPTDDRRVHASRDSGSYLVLRVGLKNGNPDHAVFKDVARQVAAFHRADVLDFDGKNFERLGKQLKSRRPENVLAVIPPQVLDVRFHRRLISLAPGLDDDPFCDFALGYFTARDGKALEALWKRTRLLHKKGLSSNKWVETSVISSPTTSYRIDQHALSEHIRAAGFNGHSLYYSEIQNDPNVFEFIDQHLQSLEEASVISMWGNGDPQGIWLFDGERNLDPERHWPYDPDRVGEDPKGEMPRLEADRFRELELKSPVLWSGTCHCGATNRVYVEGDIVSTFGTSNRCEVYELDPDESLCLAFLDAGAAALLVPLGANHGWSTMNEARFALTHGATLGEAIQSTWNDVCFQAGGLPRLHIPTKGERHSFGREHVMRGPALNRILIGDPALSLFEATESPNEKVRIERKEGGVIEVGVEWRAGFHSWGWNPFADRGEPDGRIITRVSMAPWFDDDVHQVEVDLVVEDESGTLLPHELRYAIDHYHGRRFLYLQAEAPRDPSPPKKTRTAFFRVTPIE